MPRKPSTAPSIADQLREAIQDCGLSLNQLAHASGVSQPVLWHFMNKSERQSDIKLERTAVVLCRYFGLALAPIESLPHGAATSPTTPAPRSQAAADAQQIATEKAAKEFSPHDDMTEAIEKVSGAIRRGDVALKIVPGAMDKKRGGRRKSKGR